MLQVCGNADFAQEALWAKDDAELGKNDLECDETIMSQIASKVPICLIRPGNHGRIDQDRKARPVPSPVHGFVYLPPMLGYPPE